MSGYFIFKKEIYSNNKYNFFGKGFKILSDLIFNSKKNLNVVDLNIVFKRRLNDKSKMNLKILLILINLYLNLFLKKLFY